MSTPREEPRASATIALMRPSPDPSDPGSELFFLKRHSRSPFMANAFVFPGGRLDADDAAPAVLARLYGVDDAALVARMDGVDDAVTARALVVAALRETFEESGVLIAHRADGAPVDVAGMQAERDALNAGTMRFQTFIEAHDLVLRGDRLVYFDHWITPKVEGRRYDARFFLADAPDGQRATPDRVETTEGVWLTPTAAIARHEAGALGLAPPTLCVLRDLAVLATAERVRAWASARAVPPIEPVIAQERDAAAGPPRVIVALPGDPLHPMASTAPRPAPALRLVRDALCWRAR